MRASALTLLSAALQRADVWSHMTHHVPLIAISLINPLLGLHWVASLFSTPIVWHILNKITVGEPNAATKQSEHDRLRCCVASKHFENETLRSRVEQLECDLDARLSEAESLEEDWAQKQRVTHEENLRLQRSVETLEKKLSLLRAPQPASGAGAMTAVNNKPVHGVHHSLFPPRTQPRTQPTSTFSGAAALSQSSSNRDCPNRQGAAACKGVRSQLPPHMTIPFMTSWADQLNQLLPAPEPGPLPSALPEHLPGPCLADDRPAWRMGSARADRTGPVDNRADLKPPLRA